MSECGEKVRAILVQIKRRLSQESASEIAKMLDHDEWALALEGMAIEICKWGKVPRSLDREDALRLMRDMELDTEAAFDEEICRRFSALPSE